MPKGKFIQLLSRGHMVATRDLEEVIREAKEEWDATHLFFGGEEAKDEWFTEFFGDEE